MSDNGKLSQFKPATSNANRHTRRGLGLLANAMSEVGYVAPITVAADGETLDGSARLEVAFEKFGDDVIVVKHDGTKPIVMVREDIPNAKTPVAKRISYEANRIAQVDLDWSVDQILADMESGVDLTGLWNEQELSDLLEGAADGLLQVPDPKLQQEPQLASERFIEIYCSNNDLNTFQSTLDGWAERDGVTVNIS